MKKKILKIENLSLVIIILLFSIYAFGFPVKEYSDSFQLLNQFATRDPLYSLFLLACKTLFGEGNYLFMIGMIQNLLAGISIWFLGRFLCKKFALQGVFSVGVTAVLMAPHIITPLAASSRLVLTNSILTEGISISLFYIWIYLIIKMLIEQKKADMILTFLLAMVLSLIRGQLMICVIVWVMAEIYILIIKKRKRYLILALAMFILGMGARTQFVREYNEHFWGLHIDTIAGKAMMVANMLYVSNPKDAIGIHDEEMKAVFTQIIERMEENGVSSSFATGSILDKALFHDAVHDTINFDYFEPAAREYLLKTEGIDENQYMYLMARVDDVAVQLMKELLPQVYRPYLINYARMCFLGFVRSIAIENQFLVWYVILMYIVAVGGMIYLFRRNKQSKSAIFMGVVLLLILGNVTATSLMLQCISRYMIYNLPLFYIAMLSMIVEMRKEK